MQALILGLKYFMIDIGIAVGQISIQYTLTCQVMSQDNFMEANWASTVLHD